MSWKGVGGRLVGGTVGLLYYLDEVWIGDVVVGVHKRVNCGAIFLSCKCRF